MKKFNFFEKLWEHGRTLRRVGLVLVMCLMAIPQVWAYTIWSATVFYDDKESGWNSNVYFVIEKNGGSVNKGYNGGTQIAMTHIDNTKVWVWQGAWGDNQVTYYRFAKITGTTYGWYDWWKDSDTKRVEDSWTWYQTDNWAGVSGGYGVSIDNETKKFVSTGSSAGASLNVYSVSSYPGDMNYTQNVFYATRANSGATHAKLTSGKAPATISMSSYKYTSGNYSSVTSVSPSDLTVGGTTLTRSFTAGHTATTTLTVSNVAPGYVFDGWYSAASGGSLLESGTTYTYYPQAGADVYARFTHVYGFIEGRFKVKNAARNSTTYVYNDGTWKTDQTSIPMQYDETNRRFYIHTYCTLSELKEDIGSQSDKGPWFFIRTSTLSGSITGGNQYWASNEGDAYQRLDDGAGYSNGKACTGSSKAFTFLGSSNTPGYVVIYCDGAKVWYELEYQVSYKTNGSSSGSAPTDANYYLNGTSVTVKDNTGLLVATGGNVFAGWATSSGASSVGTGMDPGDDSNNSFTITGNTDLYPVWKHGYYLITPGGSSLNTASAPFITGRGAQSSAITVNGVSFGSYCWYTSSGEDVTGKSYDSSKHLLYDVETKNADMYIYAKASSASNLSYAVIKDGVACSSSTTPISASGTVVHIPIVHDYNTRVVLTTPGSTIKIANIKVVEKGATIPTPGASGYRLTSNPNRMGSKSGTIDGMSFSQQADLKFGNSTKIKVSSTSDYFQFTTTSAVKLDVEISANKHFYVCTDKSNAATTGKSYGGTSGTTYSVNLSAANTYYLTGNDGDLTIDKIAFTTITSCTAPSALAASSITSSGATFTVTDENDANNYEIYVNTTGSAPNASTAATYTITGGKTKAVDDLAASTTYYAWARTICDYFNKSSWVALTGSYFTTSAAGCSATTPGTISKGTLSGCSITLTASGSAASNNTWYWQASADGTSTSESGATKDVTAPGTYYIRSFYSTGSCWSDAESYTVTASDLTPAAPTALAKSSVTAKGATLTVTDEADTNDYEFYVSTDDDEPGAGTSATHSVTSGKSLTITNLYAGTTFYAWARAKCGSNKSTWTALTDDSFTTSKVTMTPTLTNVTHTSGATSSIGGSDYTAEFTASTGYSMPNPTVTIDGNTATSGTDYTWSSGTLTIPADKINGNIVITLNSAAAAPSSVAISGNGLYFAGETISLTATPTGGNGPVTYQWYKGGKADGNAIEGATSATYTKASCAFDDAGSYYCKVTCGGSQSTWGQSGNAYDVKIPRLYVKTGHYYDLEKPDFGNVDFTRATASTATASIVLGSSGDYCFNIADGCGHYYGNSGTMQYNNFGPWTTNVPNTDCGLTTTNAGTYIFTINYSTWSQITTTVTFPSCTDPGLAFAADSKTTTLCDDAPTNALTNTHGVTVSYESSDETVATVASDGTLTIKKAGTTTITASSLEQTVSAVTYCADEASYTLTVSASTAAGLAYGTATMEKNVGDANFTNTLTNTNSLTGITYTSSNTAVATVDEDGEVTIKAAGTTTITASSDQQKITSTCYAAGEASYTLTVYPVYTVDYDDMEGYCATSSASTELGKVTLPTPSSALYTFLGWYTTAGTRVGGAGDEYSPTSDITLYAKWKGAACAGGGGSPTTIVLTDFGKQFSTSGPRYGRAYVGNISGDVHIIESNDAENQKIGDKDSTAIRVDYGSYIKVLGPNATVADYTTDSTFSSVSRVEFRFKMFNASSGGTTTTIDVYVGNSKVASAIEVTGEKTDPFKAISPITISPAKNGAVRIVNTGSGSTNKNIYLDSIAITYGGGSSCYQVTYNGNGATSGYVNDNRQYDADDYVFVSSNSGGFAKTGGYEFNGWNTKADGSGVDYDFYDYDYDHFRITQDTTLYAQWRIVVNSNTSNLTAYEDPAHKDVRVTNGATLTLTQDTTVRNMLVETGSTLNIAQKDATHGTKLTVKSLSLKGGFGTVGGSVKYDMPRVYIDPKSTLTKTSNIINFDIAVDNRSYYPFALPFDVQFVTWGDYPVDYADPYYAYYSVYGFPGQYAIKSYNGQRRADYGGSSANWELMYPSSGDTLKAGHGYALTAMPANAAGRNDDYAVIRFPMQVDNKWTTEGENGSITVEIEEKEVTIRKDSVNVPGYKKQGKGKGTGDDTPPANRGWNLLGVPYMSCYQASADMYDDDNVDDPATLIQGRFDYTTNKWVDGEIMYVSIPTSDFSEYIQADITDTGTKLLPGWCFFVQVADSGNLTFLSAKEAANSSLPYRVKSEQLMPTIKTGIILSGNGASDKTTILVSDRYNAAEYEINADLEKLFGENGYTLATYSLHDSTRFAYNAMSNADAANIIPIGYRAPEEGEYTFSINPRYAQNGAFEHVYLIDYEANVTTDLLLFSYSFTTARMQNDARFALNVVPRQDMPTDLENGASGINDANGVRKVIINDKLYIIIDGKMYDATGKSVR